MKEEKTSYNHVPRLGLLLDEIPALQKKTQKWNHKENFNSLHERFILYVNDFTIMHSQNSLSQFETSNVIPNAHIQINVFQAFLPPSPKIQKVK